MESSVLKSVSCQEIQRQIAFSFVRGETQHNEAARVRPSEIGANEGIRGGESWFGWGGGVEGREVRNIVSWTE